MASLKDSIDEAIAENTAFIKYPLLAIPICLTYEYFRQGNMNAFYISGIITSLIFLTFLIEIIYNTSNNKDHLLPTANIFKFLFAAIKVIIAIIPLTAAVVFFGIWLMKFQIPIELPNIQVIYSAIIWIILGAVILTSIVNYGKTKKIIDAYNIVVFYKHSIDLMILVLFLIPQLILMNGILVGTFVYLFSIFYKVDSIEFAYLCSLIAVFNITILGHYLAQAGYESIQRQDINETGFEIKD